MQVCQVSNKLSLILLILIFLMSPGCKETKYERLERLSESGYYYSDTGTLNRSLWYRGDGVNIETIPSIIIDIEYIFPYVTLVRQRKKSTVCGLGNLGVEVFDELEYWIVNIEDNSKYFFRSYNKFVGKAKVLGVSGEQLLNDFSHYRSHNKTVNPGVALCTMNSHG